MKSKIEVEITHAVPEAGSLKGSVAFVSGGTGGIGSAIVRDLVGAGCQVVAASTNEAKFRRVFSGLPGDLIRWIPLDMGKTGDNWAETISAARGAFGGLPDLWVFAAGIHSPKRNLTFLNATGNDYDSVVGIDLEATCGLTLAAVRAMVRAGVAGRMVLISSSTGGEPAWSPYRVAKRGCNAFVSDIAPRLATWGIGIWSVCPGPCATPLLGYGEGQAINLHDMQQGRYVMPEEVSPLVVSLLSMEAPLGSGESIYISGGRGTWDIR